MFCEEEESSKTYLRTCQSDVGKPKKHQHTGTKSLDLGICSTTTRAYQRSLQTFKFEGLNHKSQVVVEEVFVDACRFPILLGKGTACSLPGVAVL